MTLEQMLARVRDLEKQIKNRKLAKALKAELEAEMCDLDEAILALDWQDDSKGLLAISRGR